MDSWLYNSRGFKALDTAVFFIGEFLFGFLLFFPLVYVWYNVVTTPGIEGRDSAIGLFFTFRTPTLIVTAAGLALVNSIITMTIDARALIYLSMIAFIFAIYIGFGWAGLIIMAMLIILARLAWKNTAIYNHFVDNFNFFIGRWRLHREDREPERESIFSDPVGPRARRGAFRFFSHGFFFLTLAAMLLTGMPVVVMLFIIFLR